MAKRAIVVNGRKGVHNRIFLIRGVYIIKEKDVDEYLRDGGWFKSFNSKRLY